MKPHSHKHQAVATAWAAGASFYMYSSGTKISDYCQEKKKKRAGAMGIQVCNIVLMQH